MSDRLTQRLEDEKVLHDTRVLGDFVAIYCNGKHGEAPREALQSPGVDAGAYGERVPAVCETCRELLEYAEKRRAFCPHDPKPQCKNCPKHCYKPDMRSFMQDVMRYSGPRSILHGHAIDAIAHALDRPLSAFRWK